MGIYFIVNPVAGRGKAKSFAVEIEEHLKKRKIKYKFVYTNYPGHATQLASQVNEDKFSKIVSVGGDGTLHEILNGMNLKTMALGIIPAGTGNDLVRSVGIPMDKREALEIVLNGKKEPIDIGIVSHMRFINVAGLGLDVEVLRETKKFKRIIKGPIAYILGVLRALLTFKAINLKISIDGEVYEEEAMLCAIANGKYFGGGMKIVPTAEMDDGILDVCIIKKMPKLKLLYLFPRVFKGTHIGLPWVFLARGKKIKILSKDEVWINADGEISKELSPSFEIVEKGLNILVP